MKMKTGKSVITKGLPKTGQSVIYTPGDDGTYQAGWWLGRTQLDNKERYVLVTVGLDTMALDRATGLMWPHDGSDEAGMEAAADTWEVCLAWAENCEQGGFKDWRMPNIFEMFSIINVTQYPFPLVAEFFGSVWSGPGHSWWTSTSLASYTGAAWTVSHDGGMPGNFGKAGSGKQHLFACRNVR